MQETLGLLPGQGANIPCAKLCGQKLEIIFKKVQVSIIQNGISGFQCCNKGRSLSFVSGHFSPLPQGLWPLPLLIKLLSFMKTGS